MLADALEAVVAAVYLDKGYGAAKEVVKVLFQGSLEVQEGELGSQDF